MYKKLQLFIYCFLNVRVQGSLFFVEDLPQLYYLESFSIVDYSGCAVNKHKIFFSLINKWQRSNILERYAKIVATFIQHGRIQMWNPNHKTSLKCQYF